MIRALLLTLTLATCAFAQGALYIDLTGEWRTMRSDQPVFARSDFDDSQWSTAALPRRQLPKYGFTWFRRQIELPSWADSSQLALTLGSVAESYEVYINGKLVGAAGSFRIAHTYVARPRSFRIPPNLTAPGAHLTIALRAWRPDFVTSTARNMSPLFFPDDGPYLLTYIANAPTNVAASQMQTRERFATSSLIVSEFEAVLALILLAAWLGQRERKELVLFIGFLLLESYVLFYEYVAVVGDWPHLSNSSATASVFASSLLLAYLGAAALGVRLRWLIAYAWLQLAVFLLDNFVVAWTDATTQTALIRSFYVYAMSMAIVDLATASSVFFYLWRMYRRTGQRGSRFWFALSVGILALLRNQRGGSPLRLVDLSVTMAGYRWALFNFATLAVAFWLTIHLVRGLGAARQRLAGEMEAARAVQQLLLPPAAAGWQGYQVDAVYRPAQEVSGDFYQFIERADGSRIALLGDVSGKGLKAAMLVSVAVGVLRSQTASGPAAVLQGLNSALYEHTGGAFVTCCCVEFQPDGRMRTASAGHPAPYRAGVEMAIDPGLPLGVAPDAEYPEAVCTIAPVEQVTLVSDGVLEAASNKGELFGFERTRESSMKSPVEIAETAQVWGQNDDITVVTVRRSV